MCKEKLTKAIVLEDGKVLIAQEDGSYRPMEDKTNWDTIHDLSDNAIDQAALADPDAQPTDEDFWADAVITEKPRKTYIHTGLDADIVEFFKAQGRGYQSRINSVLRHYVDTHK